MASDLSPFNHLIKEDPIFWFCALSGSALFALQFFFNFFGGGHHHDGIDDGNADLDSGKFKWLSKQAITGFLMMFGWVGLTSRREFELPAWAATMVAFGGGGLAIFFTALILNSAKKLRSSGTIFRLEDAIGKEATVYQRIPKGGVGKISLSLHHLTYEIDAISPQVEELPSFTQVQILKKADENTVIVVPIK